MSGQNGICTKIWRKDVVIKAHENHLKTLKDGWLLSKDFCFIHAQFVWCGQLLSFLKFHRRFLGLSVFFHSMRLITWKTRLPFAKPWHGLMLWHTQQRCQASFWSACPLDLQSLYQIVGFIIIWDRFELYSFFWYDFAVHQGSHLRKRRPWGGRRCTVKHGDFWCWMLKPDRDFNILMSPMGRSGVDDAAMECWYWPLVSILQLSGHVPTRKDGWYNDTRSCPLKIWVEVIPTLCFTYAITAVTSEFWIIGEHKDADSAAITEVLVMANIPEMACMKIIGGQGCVWVRSFEWIQGGFYTMEEHEKNYYFCWCVEFPKGLVHTPIQIPSKNDVLTMISSPLGYKIPQLSPTGSLINLPRLGCTILRLKKASCGLVGQASQASLLQPRHLQMVSQIQQNSASSADDHRLMIMGYFIAKTHPLPKKVLQVAPKKNVMLAVLCHLWEATVLRNLWGTTQASATWLKPRRSALRVT